MKVFGIGLNKTGTSTLGHALRILGFEKHVGPQKDLLEQWAHGNIAPIIETAQGFNNFEDWPWPLVYKELFAEFPDAKFILTTRSSPEVWYKSLCNHAVKTGPTQQREWVYGFAMPQENKTEHIDFYEKHNADVIAFFKKHAPEKLLVACWGDGNNWETLCEFLDKSVPTAPFPHIKPLADDSKKSGIEKLKGLFRRQ